MSLQSKWKMSLHIFLFLLICELRWHHNENRFPLLYSDYSLIRDWLPCKARDSSLPYYLIHFYRVDRKALIWKLTELGFELDALSSLSSLLNVTLLAEVFSHVPKITHHAKNINNLCALQGVSMDVYCKHITVWLELCLFIKCKSYLSLLMDCVNCNWK